MRRPSSPVPRRSHDSRPKSPQQHLDPHPSIPLRRSSSDVSSAYRSNPSRLLAKFKTAGGHSQGSSGDTPRQLTSAKSPHSRSTSGSSPALSPGGAASPTVTNASASIAAKATTNMSAKSALAREGMHRLGSIPAQVALAPAMTAAASASSISLASTLTNNTVTQSSSTTDPWHILHVHVLPLFNGEALRIPIEDLNQLVKTRIGSIVSRSPSRAIGTLEQDLVALLGTGMLTLNTKLTDVEDDEKLLARVVEVWEFFWHQILPYIEGVFHPLQTDKVLKSLSRTPKSHRPSSPTLQDEATPTALPQLIDVRTLALRSFRDSLILPLHSRLHVLLSSPRKDTSTDNKPYSHPRLQQMLLVLVSTSQHSYSLATSPQQPSPGEAAVTHLLRAIRSPHSTSSVRPFSVTRLPSFFAGAAPRDRRGRIGRKSARYTTLNLAGQFDVDNDEETPRNSGFGDERDQEKAFLASLRSPGPDIEPEESESADDGAGGWGLGLGRESQEKDEDDDDEMMDWEQAHGRVEKMIGLRS